MRSILFLTATAAICLSGAVFAQNPYPNPDELQASGPYSQGGPDADVDAGPTDDPEIDPDTGRYPDDGDDAVVNPDIAYAPGADDPSNAGAGAGAGAGTGGAGSLGGGLADTLPVNPGTLLNSADLAGAGGGLGPAGALAGAGGI